MLKTRLIRRQNKLDYLWASGNVETYSPAEVYDVSDGKQSAELIVAFGWRKAFEQKRRRVIVFLPKPVWPVVEFVGTDSYPADRSLVWAVKKPGGNKQYSRSESPHRDFARFQLVVFRNYIARNRAFQGWAILVKEKKVEEILHVAWIRAHHRGHF